MTRGRAWIVVGAAGLALALLGELESLGPIVAAAVTVLGSVALALVANGGPALGAEAALGAGDVIASEALRSHVPLAASGLLLTFVFGTGATRSRTVRELVVHLAASFVGGAAAAWVTRSNAGLDSGLWTAAVVVAALLASIPWIVPADAARAFALRRLASRARGSLRWRLLRAVVAHRALADLDLPAGLRARIDRSFDRLRLDCERRVDRRLVDRVDGALEWSVEQLVRVARAARCRELTMDGLGDAGSRAVAGDQFEAEVAALAESPEGVAAPRGRLQSGAAPTETLPAGSGRRVPRVYAACASRDRSSAS